MEEKRIKHCKIILIGIFIVAIIIASTLTNKQKEKQNNINLSFPDQTVKKLNFEKIKIYSKNDTYYFTAKVINKNSSNLKISSITVTMNASKPITFSSYIGDELKKEEYKILTMQTKENLEKIKSINFNVQTQEISWVFMDLLQMFW